MRQLEVSIDVLEKEHFLRVYFFTCALKMCLFSQATPIPEKATIRAGPGMFLEAQREGAIAQKQFIENPQFEKARKVPGRETGRGNG